MDVERKSRLSGVWLIVGGLAVLMIALNFLNFRVARSASEAEHSLSTYRSGEEQPAVMNPGFELALYVEGEDSVSQALPVLLVEQLEATTVGQVRVVGDLSGVTEPALLVQVDVQQRLWTPVYGRAEVTAEVFFAYDGDLPWPRDEAVVLDESPAVLADGNFSVADTTWGLLSRPAYSEHLAELLAQEIAAGVGQDVFQRP